jgi:hypothetical protein
MSTGLKVVPIVTDPKYEHPKVQFPLPQHESSVLICAMKGSGKTNLILNMISNFYKGYFHKILTCSPSVLSDNKWDVVKEMTHILKENKKRRKLLDEVPESGTKDVPQVVFKTEQELIDNKAQKKPKKFDGKLKKKYFVSKLDEIMPFLQEQRDDMERIREKLKATKRDVKMAKNYGNRMLVILDDVAGQYKGGNVNNPMVNYILRHRHYNTSVLVVTQAFKCIPFSIRDNCNALILYETPNQKELEHIYEEWPMNMDFDQWKEMYRIAVEDEYGFLYLNTHFRKGKRAFKNFEEQLITGIDPEIPDRQPAQEEDADACKPLKKKIK